DSIGILLGKFRQRGLIAALQCLQSGLGLLFALLQLGLLAPIILISAVQRVAIVTEPNQPLHLPLLIEHVTALHDLRGRENAGECVIVGGGNRVELVIVAASAAERLAEHAAADRVDLFVGDVHPPLVRIIAKQDFGTDNQKTGGNSLPVALFN